MRLVNLRLLVALVLLLVGATVMVGVGLEDDAERIPLRPQTHISAIHQDPASTTTSEQLPRVPTRRAQSATAQIPSPSVSDLARVLRC